MSGKGTTRPSKKNEQTSPQECQTESMADADNNSQPGLIKEITTSLAEMTDKKLKKFSI